MASRDNAINVQGLEIYESNIQYYADEYINTELNNPDDIYNSSLFTGMIKYINKAVFKNNKPDTANIELLDQIWEIYTSLCYKYKKRPTILNFSLMVGIDNDTFQTWKNGEYRAGMGNATSPHSATVKKWMRECESSLVDGATEQNSIGCIFALKANYGYREAAQQIEIVGQQNQPRISPDELLQLADRGDGGATEGGGEPDF